MTIPPIRSHGQGGHLQDHNDISSTLTTHDSYLDQGVKTTDSPLFDSIKFGETQHTSTVINVSSNLSIVVDSFPIDSFRSAEYHVQISQSGIYTVTKLTVLHDDSNAGISEYGKVTMGGEIPYTFLADVSGQSAVLRCTISNGDVVPAVVKFYKTVINL